MGRIFFRLWVATLLLCGTWGAVWWWVTGLICEQITVQIAGLNQRGWTVAATEPRRAGFPLHFTATVGDLRLTGPTGMVVAARHAAIRLRPQAWGEVRADLDGVEADPFARVARLELTVIDTPKAIDPMGEPRLTVQARATDLTTAAAPPLAIEGELAWLGSLPPIFTAAEVASWRDGGGKLRVRELRISHGGATATLDGTMTVDGDLRPAATGILRLTGIPEAIDLAYKTGVLAARDVPTARLGAAALSTPGPDGTPMVALPISAQAGRLSVGPLRLFSYGPLPLP